MKRVKLTRKAWRQHRRTANALYRWARQPAVFASLSAFDKAGIQAYLDATGSPHKLVSSHALTPFSPYVFVPRF